MIAILIEQKPLPRIKKGSEMSNVIVNFEFEKETKNSVRYKEVPEEGKAPIVGSIYVQKWFAGSTKNIAISIEKKD